MKSPMNLLVSSTGKVLARAVVALVLCGSALVAVPAIASATGPWGTIATPFFNPDSHGGVAADASGNLYVGTSSGVEVYNPTTSSASYLDPSTNYQHDKLTVDNAGNVFVIVSSQIIKITPSGSPSVFASGFTSPSAITTDPQGNVYVSDFVSGSSVVFKYSNSGTSTAASGIAFFISGLAVDSAGNVYVSNYGSVVEKITPSGATTSVGSGWNRAESIAVDGAGTIFVADENSNVVQQVTASGVQSPLPLDPYGSSACTDELFIGGGTLYLYDECAPNQTLYTFGVVPPAPPAPAPPSNLSLTSELYASNVLGAPASAKLQTLTANWSASPTATSYTCTLMFGFSNPSSFTLNATQTSCTFSGLDPTTSYGIQVVANLNGLSSTSVIAFATPPALPKPPVVPPKHHHHHRPHLRSILCAKGSHRLRIITVNPHCPAGWTLVP